VARRDASSIAREDTMTGRLLVSRLLVATVAAAVAAPLVARQAAPVREILHIAGDVYQFRNNGHYGIFQVTPDGVILVDPIVAGAATWVKGELANRFPGRPVRVIIYSHQDGDHTGGAEVFADTVREIVAQENAPRGIAADDRVNVMPTRTFAGRTTVTLGGKTVELMELGPGHTDNLIGVRFPDEQILFVVDIFSGRRLPFQGLAGAPDIDTIAGTLRRIETMDFRILATGHSAPSNVADLVAYRTFLETLRAQVLQARRDGKSIDEMKQTITMPAYREWVNHNIWLAPSIENMNAYLDRVGAR
jgi:glyoxylase-like metal-dependent hydrolase (beta-lactamase superfamily II)